MDDIYVPRIGGVLSADIAVPEHARELRFYSRILTTGENPLWREDLMNNLGMPIIGLGERVKEYESLPLQWMPHIQVADVATSVACAMDLGGSEILHGKDEGGNSLWAALFDPNGAAFGIMPVVSAEDLPSPEGTASTDPSTPMGCIGWVDLTVEDAAATRDFYQHVVGWKSEDVEMGDGGNRYSDYNMLCENGNPAAGICHARGSNRDLPPVWMHYLPVGDLDESLRRVPQEGGKVIKATRTSEGKYSYACIQDPVGVHIALVEG